MKALSFVVVLCCVLNVWSSLTPKQLAGPADEFDAHRLPKPYAGALVDGSAMFHANFAKIAKQNPQNVNSNVVWQQKLLVDSDKTFGFSFFSPYAENLKLDLVDSKGQKVPLSRFEHQDHFPIGGHSVPGTTYVFDKPVIGQWTLTVSHTTTMNLFGFIQSINKIKTQDQKHDAIVLQWNESPLKIYTHLNTYNLVAGQQVGLVTTITEQSSFSTLAGARASVNVSSISVAQMDMIKPDGSEVDVAMHDDGLSSDGVANDGTYGAFVVADEVGNYAVQAIVEGVRNDGVAFVRSTQHVLAVTSADLKLVGTANGVMKSSAGDNSRMNINLAITMPQAFPHLNPKFRAYAEVWGKDSSNNDVPVCWVSSMVKPQGIDTSNLFITLELDLKWLALAKAAAPITLKNVYVQDAYTMIPLSEVEQIAVNTNTDHVLRAMNFIGDVKEISLEMKQGVMPAHIQQAMNDTSAGAVVLVHGYCAGSNPWSANTNQWNNALFFLNANANLENEDFADKVYAFTQTNGVSSKFSVVGHSQGGIVGTHLLNYYFTGMDAAASGRKVQSVGTPYKGCGGAGSAANLANLFGVGCGENYDLTHDGSLLWLAGISKEAQQNVYYYTTTYELGNFFGDYCNLAVNFVLDWPNDGTTELDHADLPNGHNMGNKQKWCHTTDMGYPAQYTDAARNAEMNANAAR